LDTPETIGQLQNTVSSGNLWSITGTSTLTMDNTGGPLNPFGNAWASIRITSSGPLNLGTNSLVLNQNLDLSNSGSTSPTITIGGAISATTTATIFFRNNQQGENISGSVGLTGSPITLDNVSSRTASTTGNGGAIALSATLGSDVSSIIENVTGNVTGFSNSTITISGANPSFVGSVSVLDGIITVSGSGTLGNNNVINVGAGGLAGAHLNLNSVDTVLGAGATLDTITGSVVNLGYTGTDDILALSLTGGSTYVSPGIYGSVASGAPNTSSIFTGLGTLTIVPEPSTWALLTGAVSLLAAFRRRQRA